jgi:hypothetical protein
MAAGLLSWLIGKGIGVLLPAPEISLHTFLVCMSAIQLTVLFMLLPALGIIQNRHSTFNRLMLTWPVSKFQLWVALLLPGLVLMGMSVVLLAIPIFISFYQSLPSFALILLAGILGVATALGLLYGIPRRYTWAQVCLVPTLAWAEYQLLGQRIPGAIGLGLITLLLIGLLIYSYHTLTRNAAYTQRNNSIHTSYFPVNWWFLKKIWRTPSLQLNFITTFLLSLGIAIILRNQPDIGIQITVACILAATYGSDIRSVAQQYKPTEIAGVRGTLFFMSRYFAAAIIGCSIAISPLLIGVESSIVHWLQLAGGIAIGVFAGTLIIPEHRDILGQCVATLICTSAIILPPHISLLNSLVPGVLEALIIVIFVGTAYAIEYQRNPYNWRTYVSQ